ncbi:HAD-IA family hydrolase [Planctomycetota bacterium]|nr:HAD-IA family hydrolase [Planctomycetota bacterium]
MACKIEMVCFDLGRVLIGICDDWGEACKRAGYEVNDDNGLAGVVMSGWKGAAKESLYLNEIGALSSEVLYRDLGEYFGVDWEIVRDSGKKYLKHKFEGVDELVSELKGKGLKLAVLSNTNDVHWNIMTGNDEMTVEGGALPFDEMDHLFASHLLADKKPNASIYWMAESLSGVKGGHILFFDDLVENVEAARECGWNAERVTDRVNPVREMRGYLKEYGVI